MAKFIDLDEGLPALLNKVKAWVNSNLATKQDTLTFDNAPTANSNNPVKSGGVYTALAGKQAALVKGTNLDATPTNGSDNPVTSDGVYDAIAAIPAGADGKSAYECYVETTSDNPVLSESAWLASLQGPQGDSTITDLNDVMTRIVNNLTTGGGANILSAEMGKVLKTAISTLIDSMGEYCFPNGRPTLSWEGAKADIIPHFNNSHVSSSNTAQRVDIGASFETTLGTDDNLYVIDDDSVVVKMGGVTQVGAYAAATGKVTIAEVTDYIEITANAITYVGYGESNGPLVSMFDGKSVDAANNQWIDKIDNTRVLQISGCTVASDHVEFDGVDDSALAATTATGIDVPRLQGTVEAVANGLVCNSTNTLFVVMSNHYTNTSLIAMLAMYSSYFNNSVGASFITAPSGESNTPKAWLLGKSSVVPADNIHLSMSDSRAYLNGDALTRANQSTYVTERSFNRLGVCTSINASGNVAYYKGNIYCVRSYNRALTEAEVMQNYKVDRKRFNLI